MHLRWYATILALALLVVACAPTPTPTPAPTESQPSPPEPSIPSTAPATTPPDLPLAALVNAQAIYLVDYERQVAQYQEALVSAGVDLASPEGQQRLLQMREQILNWMIEQALIEQAAAGMGIVVTDDQVAAALAQIIQDAGSEEAFQAQLERSGLTQQDVWTQLRAELVRAAVMEQVTASVPTSTEHVHARHILVSTPEEAEQLLSQLQAGADFAELARTYSQDESTRLAGGDLGWFPRGVLLAAEVEEAAFSLQPGQISTVVQSPFGFHIVQVIEREPDRAVSPENLQLLQDQAAQQWIETLWAQATIERYVNLSP